MPQPLKDWNEAHLQGISALEVADAIPSKRKDTTGERRDTKPRLSFILFGDIEHAPRKRWIVQGFLGEGELSCDFGPPSAGKSILVADRCAHVAAARPWFGRRVQPCAVLHVAAERAAVVKRRYAAFRKHHEISELPLAVVGGSVNLCTSLDDAKLIVDLCKKLEDMAGIAVELVTIETVNRVLAGGDENSPRDMGALVGHLAFLQEETGAHIEIVHHIPADGTQRLRGHGALLGAVDTTMRIEKLGKLRTCTVDKANDGEEGERVVFDLMSVELHHDEETNITTTAPVVVPHEGEVPKASQNTRRAKLPASAQIALAALKEAITTTGTVPPTSNHIPENTKTVTKSLWRKYAYARGISNGEDRAKEKAFERGTTRLVADGLAGAWGDDCWLTQ